MSGAPRRVSAGRVGRPHGRDGAFYVERPDHPLEEGTPVEVAGNPRTVELRAGSDERPLIRLSGLDDRKQAAALRGEPLLVDGTLDAGEWLTEDLLGLRVGGLGRVTRVIEAPSCALLELEDGRLIPFVSDAIRSVDPEAGSIQVDHRFLGESSDER